MAGYDQFVQDIITESTQLDINDAGGNNQRSGSAEAEAPGPGHEDDRITILISSSSICRKLFVGALSWETTDKDLRDHFEVYGEIDRVNVKIDPRSGRSRGFAFIVFKAPESIDHVLAAGDHLINNRKVDPKKAKPRYGKIFVDGLSSEVSDSAVMNFFANFGTIIEIEIPFDKLTNQRKGFCVITFASERVAYELLKTPTQMIGGKRVDVKHVTH